MFHEKAAAKCSGFFDGWAGERFWKNQRIFSVKFVDFFEKLRIISSCMDTLIDCKIPECGPCLDLTNKRVVVGAKQLRKALNKGSARFVYLAENADPAVTEPLEALCQNQNVSYAWVRSMQELGTACGIEVGAAAAAILS